MLQGFIRDEHIDEAEAQFPGIRALYLGCADKPRTFLELVARWLETAGRYQTRTRSFGAR